MGFEYGRRRLRRVITDQNTPARCVYVAHMQRVYLLLHVCCPVVPDL
jgi:phage-related protein